MFICRQHIGRVWRIQWHWSINDNEYTQWKISKRDHMIYKGERIHKWLGYATWLLGATLKQFGIFVYHIKEIIMSRASLWRFNVLNSTRK